MVELGGTVDVKIIEGFGGGSKMGDSVRCGYQIAGLVISKQNITVGFGGLVCDWAVFGKVEFGPNDGGFET